MENLFSLKERNIFCKATPTKLERRLLRAMGPCASIRQTERSAKLSEAERRAKAVIAETGEVFERLAQHDTTGVELKAELEKHELVDPTGKLIDAPHGKQLLRLACLCGNAGCAKVLLDLGVSPLGSPLEYTPALNGVTCAGRWQAANVSCVHLAALLDNAEVLAVLLSDRDFGDLANVSQVFRLCDERTPLMSVASRYRQICRGMIGKMHAHLVKCTTEVARLYRFSIQSCTQNRPSPKVQSRS